MGTDDPISFLALKSGTDVFSSDGERIGVVEHVLVDEATDVFDGLVVDTSLGPGGLRFVDAPEVADIREARVTVAVTAANVDRLPRPEANPAVMEHHGAEDSEGRLAHKLRRAWEIVSGKG